MKQEQILEKQEQIKLFSGEILSIKYNQIAVKRDDDGRTENIYFDGLQKRVLSGVNEELLKRIKRIEWTDSEFWDRAINLFVCCDDCKNSLFSIFDDIFVCDEKITCNNCGKWLCSDCVKNNYLCEGCFRKEVIVKL